MMGGGGGGGGGFNPLLLVVHSGVWWPKLRDDMALLFAPRQLAYCIKSGD